VTEHARWLPLPEAAEELGLTIREVLEQVNARELEARRRGEGLEVEIRRGHHGGSG